MNALILQPNDVLFFRDGRPMTGGLAGHGAAWPLPTVTNAALHAALWRAGLADSSHPHRLGRNGKPVALQRTRRFGSLLSAGPFPVRRAGGAADDWLLPRPADALEPGTNAITLRPVPVNRAFGEWSSGLPALLNFALANSREPAKDKKIEPWWSHRAFEDYLRPTAKPVLHREIDFLHDSVIFQAEPTVGIGMDAATGAQDGERIYSAHYLRLRDEWRLGLLAQCDDKKGGDLLARLFQQEKHILVGGQQRACSVDVENTPSRPPFPLGQTTFIADADGKCRVKWILLAPAVWPAILDEDQNGKPLLDRRRQPIRRHVGGWLPNWVADHADSLNGEPVVGGEVLLMDGLGLEKAIRQNSRPGQRIQARLVAAIVPKAIPVTGYALPHEDTGGSGGPKPLHLAVPAGAVYYFETQDAAELTAAQHAKNLATALNWHGEVEDSLGNAIAIKNRRSTLFGEKGFGLGLCGSWKPITT